MESKLLFFQETSHPIDTWKIQHSFTKRVFDLVFSTLLLAILSPLFLGIALAIRISCGGEAIYAQFRLGRGGKVFKCYKFRTMHTNADRILQRILSENPEMRQEWIKKQKLKNDPRIFPLGKWLRRTSLDELPQFWNVLKGDLSIVGPRPYMVSQKKYLKSQSSKILSVRPGITGLWQTSGRNETTFEHRMKLDIAYINHHSFGKDLVLILKTIPQVFMGKDAY
jgi:exopolysaccharide production protein ExoY